jgi:breast carcinoma amplified sequence 2 (BCAS2)
MNNHSCSKFLAFFPQNNALLASELERVGARQPLAAIDTSRYQLTPSSTTPSSDEEWKSALDGAYALLEHQRIRYSNPYFSVRAPTHFLVKAQQPRSASTIWEKRMART